MTSNRELINNMISHQRETLKELRVLSDQMVISDEVYEQLRTSILNNIAGLEHLRGQIPNGEAD